MTPQEKIARIQAKQKEKHQQELKEKQEKWREIQTEFPEVAKMLNDINKTFGKPKAIGIKRSNGELAFYSGKFDKPKDLVFKSKYVSRYK